MKARSNTVIDDVAAIIGFSATVRLIQWYGGRNIYVPDQASPGHPLVALMGESALRALCGEFGNQTLWVPASTERADVALKKSVAKAVLKGRGSADISRELGITQRQVQRLRRELEDAGLIPTVLKSRGEKSQEKTP